MNSSKFLLDDAFEQRAQALLDEYHIPGLSIAVVDDGEVSARGIGLARLPDVAATPDTLYYAGSTTKAMLAAATGVVMHGPKDDSDTSLTNLQNNKWTTTIQSALPEKFKVDDEYALSQYHHRGRVVPSHGLFRRGLYVWRLDDHGSRQNRAGHETPRSSQQAVSNCMAVQQLDVQCHW